MSDLFTHMERDMRKRKAMGLVPVNGELVEVEFEIPDRVAQALDSGPLHISIKGEEVEMPKQANITPYLINLEVKRREQEGVCTCIPHWQDAGGGHTEFLLEPDPDCSVHFPEDPADPLDPHAEPPC